MHLNHPNVIKWRKIGTGLGLYIVKATINEYNGSSVQVLYQSEGFAVK